MDESTVAHVAIGVAWTAFGLLCLAVLGALCESLPDGTLPGVGMALVSGFSVLLRVIALVTLMTLLYRLLITYGHVGRSTHTRVKRGRHRPAYVKRHPWTPARITSTRAARLAYTDGVITWPEEVAA